MIDPDGGLAIPAGSWSKSSGVETLRRMATVDNYNLWVFRSLSRYVKGRLLEVGCGIGNMTPYFLGATHLTCIDVLAESVAVVRHQFRTFPHVNALVADISDPESVEMIGAARYQTAVCINVLEHIENDLSALRNIYQCLAPGGNLLLFVPAGQFLYGHLDQALGHYRRYSLSSLRAVVESANFQILEEHYMNVAGIPGWYLSSRILRREAPPRGLLSIFNTLAPLFIWCEEKVRPPFGQSVVCIAHRPE